MMFENITRKFYASPNVPSAQEPDPIDVAVRSSFKMNRIYPNSEQKDLSAVIVYAADAGDGNYNLFYDEDCTKPADADYIFELAIRNLLVIYVSGKHPCYYFPSMINDARAEENSLTIMSPVPNVTGPIYFRCTRNTNRPDPDDSETPAPSEMGSDEPGLAPGH